VPPKGAGMAATWIDLLDPTREELETVLPPDVHPRALDQLLEPLRHDDEPRPTLEGHGSYVFGVFLVAVAVPEKDEVYYQEIDLVLTRDSILTVRKSPAEGAPFDCAAIHELHGKGRVASSALIAYHVVDQVAEAYLDLVDAIDEEIDELEDHVEEWPSGRVRQRISTLRHDLLHVRRTLAPTRDAVHRVFDGRIDLDGEELFDREVELHFADAYDKLLRAFDGLELARDLVAGVRDYHLGKVANDQNEVMKRLTAIASILLVPTFIVGLYGQNFDRMPELHWRFGYAFSWGLIVVTTLLQLWWFRRKRWI
jgi:magnesium transporter